MKRTPLTLFVLLVIALLSVAIAPPTASIQAQEDTEPLRCDSTTILLLYLAQYHYAFDLNDIDIDVLTLDAGQFTPLFESMPAADDGMADNDMGGDGADGMEEGGAVETVNPLTPPVIPDEDSRCTALREEVELYLTLALLNEGPDTQNQ